MKAIKAVFQNGSVTMLEEAPAEGPVEVLVVFPNGEEDPWEKILNEPVPRASFMQFAERVKADIAAGKSAPLDPDML